MGAQHRRHRHPWRHWRDLAVQHPIRGWRGTVPWRLGMGALALVITFSAFFVVPLVPGVGRSSGGGGPASSARPGQNIGVATAAADTVSGKARDATTAVNAADESWTPQPANYGTGSNLDQPVAMSDGTVLRAGRLLPHNEHERAGERALPRVVAADSLWQGVHRRTRRRSPTRTSTTSSTGATSS